jgi:hypothetical protein
MHNNRLRLGCRPLLLCSLLLTSAGVAHATLSAYSFAGYAEPHAASLVGVNGASGTSSTAGTTSPTGLASAAAYGEADYGALHASSQALAANGDAQARGQGSSLWIDNATVSSSFVGMAIGRGTFNLSGALAPRVDPSSTAAIASSSVAATVRVNGVAVLSIGAQLLSRNGVIEINDIDVGGLNVSFASGQLAGAYSFDIPFTLGTPFQLWADLTALAQTISFSGVDDAEAHSDFASTGSWGGFSNVHLTDGTVVSDFSVTSGSGFDWSHAYGFTPPPVTAVPEPGTYALMLAGLALLGRAARRRTQATTP